MKVQDLKPGDKVIIDHQRKGIIKVEVTSNDSNSEWLGTIVLSEKIKGLVNEWVKGEDLSVRKSLIVSINNLKTKDDE